MKLLYTKILHSIAKENCQIPPLGLVFIFREFLQLLDYFPSLTIPLIIVQDLNSQEEWNASSQLSVFPKCKNNEWVIYFHLTNQVRMSDWVCHITVTCGAELNVNCIFTLCFSKAKASIIGPRGLCALSRN